MWSLFRVTAAVLLLAVTSVSAAAQGGTTSSISGTVVDDAGAVVPGATVVVTQTATQQAITTVSNASGIFSVPSLNPGTYSVTVSLSGFRNYSVNGLILTPGAPVSVSAVLSIGGVEEVVEVSGSAASLVNTQTPVVQATLMADQINKMPMASRNLINSVTYLPGVSTATTNRNSQVNGLPASFIAISFDGINNNENLSGEGFFATLSPRQDAMEAVTVTTANAGADVGGHGAVTINFVTRSGANRFDGSAYEYHRHARLNSNYWFNRNAGLPRNQVTLNQYGFRQGGPLIPNKAFFFFNYEEVRQPSNATRNRTLYNERTQDGWYRYNVTSGGVTTVREVNVLDLARAGGFNAALDPTVARTLGLIRNAAGTTGLITQQTDPNLLNLAWQSSGVLQDRQPTARIDYNFNARHRLSSTFALQKATRDPDLQNNGDVRFPGASNYAIYSATRPLISFALRSTLSQNLVHELRAGARWSPSYFSVPESAGPHTFEDTGGYSLSLGLNATGWTTENTPHFRNAWNYQFSNTLTWQRGRHSISAGTEFYFGNITIFDNQTAPAITFGVADNDPATALFTTANFQGASTAQLNSAAALFATLTGRVTSVGGEIALDRNSNQYELFGRLYQQATLNVYSAYIQDNWRATNTLTLTGGLRYGVQTPWSPINDVLSQATYDDACGVSGKDANGTCRFFQPGASGGIVPSFTAFNRNTATYKTDWNNLAPVIGVAWRPNVQSGWLRGVLGDPESATVRGGYSVQYDRQGHSQFTDVFGGNPGGTLTVTRNQANGLLAPDGNWPVYLSDTDRLRLAEPCPAGIVNAGCNPGTVSYPIPVRANRADNINVFDPDIQISSARSYTLGFQRSLSPRTVIEARYVGTRGSQLWGSQNYNERNLVGNGFLDEFQAAIQNLRVAVANGCGQTGQPACSFAYRGPGTGTTPLPIYLAHFNGSADAGNPAAYSGANWTNATFVGRLAPHNPNLALAAQDLDNDAARRANAIRAGLPANFFVLNPDVNAVNVRTSQGLSNYDALQIELRRRLANGLDVNGSYVFAHQESSSYLGRNGGDRYVLDPAATVRHAFKAQWNWQVPVGRGERFGADLPPVVNGILGGWSLNGVARVQARVLDFGSVRLVGMTARDLQREYGFRITDDPANPGRQIVSILPEDIVLNTRRAFNTSATTANGYSEALGAPDPNGRYLAPAQYDGCISVAAGDCAPRSLLIRAPWFTRVDISLSKRIPLAGRTNIDLSVNIFNLFDNVNFTPVANPGTGATIFQVTGAYQDASNTYDPGGRLGELVFRLNW